MIYHIALAKLLGLVAIWVNKFKRIKGWTYAGFFFDLVLAFTAHVMVEDGGQLMALFGLVIWLGSYFSWRKEVSK